MIVLSLWSGLAFSSGWDVLDGGGVCGGNAVLSVAEVAERLVDLHARAHHTAQRAMHFQAMGRAERHHLVEIADAVGTVGGLPRQPDRGDGAVRAFAGWPIDGRVLDGLRLGIGPQLRPKLEHCIVAREVVDRRMAEASSS